MATKDDKKMPAVEEDDSDIEIEGMKRVDGTKRSLESQG